MSRLTFSRGESWSIGGPQASLLGSPIVGKADGLSGSHNKYESDASPGRGGIFSVQISLNATGISD